MLHSNSNFNFRQDLLSSLPTEVSHMVIEKLSPEDLVNVQLTCKRWRELVMTSRIWRDFCRLFMHETWKKDVSLSYQDYWRIFRGIYDRLVDPRKHTICTTIDTQDRSLIDLCVYDINDGKLAMITSKDGRYLTQFP